MLFFLSFVLFVRYGWWYLKQTEKDSEDLSLSALFPYAIDKMNARKSVQVRYRLASKLTPPPSARAPMPPAELARSRSNSSADVSSSTRSSRANSVADPAEQTPRGSSSSGFTTAAATAAAATALESSLSTSSNKTQPPPNVVDAAGSDEPAYEDFAGRY